MEFYYITKTFQSQMEQESLFISKITNPHPLGTGRKLNVNMTFRRPPVHIMYNHLPLVSRATSISVFLSIACRTESGLLGVTIEMTWCNWKSITIFYVCWRIFVKNLWLTLVPLIHYRYYVLFVLFYFPNPKFPRKQMFLVLVNTSVNFT